MKTSTLGTTSSKYVWLMATEIVTESNDFSGRNFHFSKYNGQTETR